MRASGAERRSGGRGPSRVRKIAPEANPTRPVRDKTRGAPSAAAPRTMMRLWFRLVCVAAGMLLWLGCRPGTGAIARATRAALHHRHDAGRSDDRCLQQDHRAESILRREAGDDLLLARGRLEQEGQLPQVIADATEAIRLQPSAAALQSARLGLLRQGRVRHRDIGFQRRAADRAAERHHLSQPRQRLARQRRIRQGDRRLRSIESGPPIGVFLAEPRHLETGARRSRRCAGRHQRSDPARPEVAPPLKNRAVIWRAKGDLDRAVADGTEAIRLARAEAAGKRC